MEAIGYRLQIGSNVNRVGACSLVQRTIFDVRVAHN